MEDTTAVYIILKNIREHQEHLKNVIAAGLPNMETYAKATGEYKAYQIIEQEIQDLQKDEDNDDQNRKGTT